VEPSRRDAGHGHPSPATNMWILTHRDNIENLTYDTLAGRIMHIDIRTGKILGAIESPATELAAAPNGHFFVG